MSLLITLSVFCTFFGLLLAAAIFDIRMRTIPNGIVISIVALWVVWQIVLFALQGTCILDAAFGYLMQALVLGAFLLAFVVAVETMQKKPVMGGGDIKLLTAATLFLGARSVLIAMFIASAVSLLYAAANKIMRSSRGIPFAPCILAGTLMAIIV